MKRFIQKALEKLDKMDFSKIKNLVLDISLENSLLEMILHSMTSGIIVLDRENRISLMNKASRRLIPFVSEDVYEKVVWQTVSDVEIANFLKMTLLNQERVKDKEFAIINKGNLIVISCSTLPLVKERRIEGTLINVQDITEKKAKEARLRRAESLASLTTLTAGIAHEIKNPLGSIGIHIQLIQKMMKNKDCLHPNDIGGYLDVINEEVNRLNKIVVDFLFAVRPMDLKLEDSDINELIKDLLEFLKFELENAGVELETELGEVPVIPVDEKYLKQALLNIIQNALSAMPDGGVLKIITAQDDDKFLIKITDTGHGIPQDVMEKIFEPFFTTKEFGSGLGLTLVFKIVKELQGDIMVNSKVGEGTTFIISLPIPQKEQKLIDYRSEY
ncbi:MAG: PAS domain S-box protein [Spirochaetales bacterium]|nr:PAS domain S-box protein [Spirochaetales bacterium]